MLLSLLIRPVILVDVHIVEAAVSELSGDLECLNISFSLLNSLHSHHCLLLING